MHLHFERNVNSKCDCTILSLSWMGKVPDDIPEDDGWKLNRTNYYQDGWLATGNVRGIVGVTFTTSHSRKNVEYPLRTNYNLRGHRSDVILVKWNEPYQKLASCDSSGIIFVWIKYEGRWSIELINDRNTPVTHFSWSHDGRMALICYQDGFVLVGSVAGQRYWSSMLNLESTITCGIWTPDDQQVYFGTTQGQVIVMDVHGAMVSQVQLYNDIGITSMSWSCEKFKMEEGEESEPGVSNAAKRSFVLAVSFQNGFIYLLKSFDDVSPAHINTGFDGALGMVMEWSNSRELLAVAGSLQKSVTNSNDSNDSLYENSLQFYTEAGALIYVAHIPYCIAAVSALTWGHNDKRLFIATGSQLHIAWISRRVATLQLLCRLQIQNSIGTESALPMLPLPNRIKTLIGNLFSQTIRCCVPDLKNLRDFVSRPPMCSTRLHCTMIRHDEEANISSGTCYTLYLEYLGGLVPLLKGKRTSKIRPEFVIFDPQVNACAVFGEKSSGSKTSSTSSQSTNGTTTNAGSDSSESDYEERRRNSPRRQHRRRLKNSRNNGTNPEKNNVNSLGGNDAEGVDELIYLDTLLEDVKLVEVTSNIWGTKFKIHGLAKTVPANLGQITYKTSLLHLQPRQMTLVITELRDDCPFGPDPNFNPNLFSEDEDDTETHISSNSSSFSPAITKTNNNCFTSAPTSEGSTTTTIKNAGRRLQENILPVAPMSPRPNRLLSRHKSSIKGTQLTNLGRSPLARAESYEDEANSIQDLHNENNTSATTAIPHTDNFSSKSTRLKSTTTSCYVRNSNGGSCTQSRQAISPLFNDGSVPTLQSPKNAVAPTDIIFERPAVTAAGQTTLMSFSNNTNYTNNMAQLKSAFLHDNLRSFNGHVNPVPLNLNLNTERMDPPSTSLRKDILFIDEEGPSPISQQDMPLSAITASALSSGEPADKTTPTGTVAIAPECTGSMTRSCSVGFLDSAVITPSAEALVALRRDTPNKRLVLVVDKRKVRKKRLVNEDSNRILLQPTRKSKSFDSSEMLTFSSKSYRKLDDLKESNNIIQMPSSANNSVLREKPMQLPDKCEKSPLNENDPNTIVQTSPCSSKKYESKGKRKEFITSFTDSPLFSRKYRFRKDTASPTMSRKNDSSGFNIIKQLSENRWRKKSAKSTNDGSSCNTQLQDADALQPTSVDNKTSVSLHTQALTTLENIISRIRDLDEGRLTPPSTPKRFPRSSPASPASIKKTKRQQSNSPIKNIWNSPLLNRRQRKKLSITESSDDEVSATNGGSGLEDNSLNINSNTCTKQFRDLETFQKAQLRQKLKRGRIEPNGSSNCNSAPAVRREFVMHNKTPMWNEMSQVYQLDFGGRVTQESAKNFQIEFRGKQVMQFGRIDGNAYTLDFQYPFSALQAFAVALANVTQRLK